MAVRHGERVRVPVMYQDWLDITFIHWRYPVEPIQRMLPDGLTVDSFDGSAWVGLTPLLMSDVRPPGVPAIPWLSRFPETNVRTYARDAEGRTGLWFLSLDAARLPAVLTARATYRLPYHWAAMSVTGTSTRRVYRSHRHRSAGAHCHAEVELGSPLAAPGERAELLTGFLTERYRLFTVIAGRLAHAEVEHVPWPLHEARLRHLDQDLLQAASLPAPGGTPLVHASPGVRVRVGPWSLR
ncbi:DUF2071 domain-containing protein [Sphaerisporangium rubeum]|uniref:DUF2071 domain-containing protein n=1 Tax=Sphaerisporangium rubeum TaxID=321317 RepID=A0A7X0M7C0_9ACTN|nr:DUF2071 domain-containing protein [Sphaerisporangium rubeum]MBB6472686.1 hypothetical protein [Sphaerisporangium rubeum]